MYGIIVPPFSILYYFGQVLTFLCTKFFSRHAIAQVQRVLQNHNGAPILTEAPKFYKNFSGPRNNGDPGSLFSQVKKIFCVIVLHCGCRDVHTVAIVVCTQTQTNKTAQDKNTKIISQSSGIEGKKSEQNSSFLP